MDSEYILGLDIGTSSVRAALFDHRGRMLPETFARRTYVGDGVVEFDPDSSVADLSAVIDEAFERFNESKGEVTHVASCSFWHGLLGVDEKGKPTTKVLTWADTRSRGYTDVLRKRFDETEVHARTGARFHSSFWPSKLLYIRKEFPDVWKRTYRWLSLGDYVFLRLCGTTTTSVSMASATGIFDQRKCEWDAKLLRFLKLREDKFPTIAARVDDAFMLSTRFQKRWPRLQNARWLSSIGDGAANNIGAGCTTKSRAALMIGTSGAMRVAYEGEPTAKLPSGLWSYRIDRKRVIVGGALSDGGGLYQWLKENLKLDLSDEDIAAEIARRGADAHGLTAMPFFFGERSTGYNENARGSILGLTTSHDAIDILQAAMEAVAFRFAEVFDQMKQVSTIEEIVASGGALDNSPTWTQIIADVLGRDLLVSKAPEASLHGAALLALESIGKIKNLEEVSTVLNPKQFHPKCHKIYKAARKRHVAAYERLLNHKK